MDLSTSTYVPKNKWGKKNKTSTLSNFFEGVSINAYMNRSLYGKFIETLGYIPECEYMDTSDGAGVPMPKREEFKIPTVVVIGAESSGKSSLLEHIIKCPVFPRNSSICTKQPIKLLLRHSENPSDTECAIKLGNEIKRGVNKYDIMQIITEHMEKYEPEEIVEEPIEIMIKQHNLPNFEFVDLPGIRAYPESLSKKTLKLAESYISQPNTIVLCVCPAQTPRMTSYNPIALIKKYGLESKTILALTMCDRVQPIHIYDLIVRRITMETDEIEPNKFAGCVGIINRTHDDSENLESSDVAENTWFEENIINDIPDDFDEDKTMKIHNNLTIGNLIKNLDKLYCDVIRKDWIPQTLDDLNTQQTEIEEQIVNIGLVPSSLSKKKILNCYKTIIEMFRTNVSWNIDFLKGMGYFNISKNIEHMTIGDTIQDALYVFDNYYINANISLEDFINCIGKITHSAKDEFNTHSVLKLMGLVSDDADDQDLEFEECSDENTNINIQDVNSCSGSNSQKNNICTNMCSDQIINADMDVNVHMVMNMNVNANIELDNISNEMGEPENCVEKPRSKYIDYHANIFNSQNAEQVKSENLAKELKDFQTTFQSQAKNNLKLLRFIDFNYGIFKRIVGNFKTMIHADFKEIFTQCIFQALNSDIGLSNMNMDEMNIFFKPLIRFIELSFNKACVSEIDNITRMTKDDTIGNYLVECQTIVSKREMFGEKLEQITKTIETIERLNEMFE